ncbi:MAG: 2-dehydro-3-deoxygalactonokinase [Alphaproteobacteria bacterium]|nr:2-dehydro-3-deoxygalactonokinase [Alphaproteobacteria bacterium]
MWLAVDAAGQRICAWPVGADGPAQVPVAVERLDLLPASPAPVVIDGSPDAPVLACPFAIDSLRGAVRHAGGRHVLPLLRDAGAEAGAARLVGALELARWRDAPARGRLVGICGADGAMRWGFARDGRIERLRATATGAALGDLLRRTTAQGAADEDDDVAFERGLSIAEDARDLEADLDRVMGEGGSGRLRGGAVGATLAGVLVGHDAAHGLRLCRLGAPVLLVGEGLLADRYATALGRFGVAARRFASLRALVAGCRLLAGMSDSDCEGGSAH